MLHVLFSSQRVVSHSPLAIPTPFRYIDRLATSSPQPSIHTLSFP